jgi:hypothetical protein
MRKHKQNGSPKGRLMGSAMSPKSRNVISQTVYNYQSEIKVKPLIRRELD